jgi:hypothetical protein
MPTAAGGGSQGVTLERQPPAHAWAGRLRSDPATGGRAERRLTEPAHLGRRLGLLDLRHNAVGPKALWRGFA